MIAEHFVHRNIKIKFYFAYLTKIINELKIKKILQNIMLKKLKR